MQILFPLNSNVAISLNKISRLTTPNNTCVTNVQTTIVLHAFLTSTFLLQFNSLRNLHLHTVQAKSHFNLLQKRRLKKPFQLRFLLFFSFLFIYCFNR